MQCIRCGLKPKYFPNFGFFPAQSKTDFSLCFVPIFKLLNFFFFELAFLINTCYLLELLNYFFFLKIRVIKLLIIYLIYREGVVWCGFLIIKPQIALHYAVRFTVAYGAVRLCLFASGFGEICAVW